MRRSHLIAGITASAAIASFALAPSAGAAPLGDKSLASVLKVNPHSSATFDHHWGNYSILREAVEAILHAKPNSPVGTLAKGNVAATCFLPNDRAFRIFANQAFPRANGYSTERAVFNALATKTPGGINTLETIVLYHCTAGTIDSAAALNSNGATLTMLAGGSVSVAVRNGGITLRDAAARYKDPSVNKVDLNKGNKQIAHGIDRVLLPLNLAKPIAN